MTPLEYLRMATEVFLPWLQLIVLAYIALELKNDNR